MLRIRLRRVGAKKQASYRIVVAESTSPRDGKFVEVIGFYNPRTEPETVTIKEERALYWLSVGAQPSDPVVRLLKNNGTSERLARLKAGESMEELVAEEQAERAAREEVPKVETSTPEPEDVEVEETEEDVSVVEDEVTLTEDTSENETVASTEEDEVESEETDGE